MVDPAQILALMSPQGRAVAREIALRAPLQTPTIIDAVAKEVRRVLGREPVSKLEAIRAKKQIYDANGGLLEAACREDRRRRLGL